MTTLEDLIEAFSASLRRGVTPDIDAFVQRAPEHAEALYALLPTLLKMEAFAQESTGLPCEIELPLPHLLNAEFRLERQIGRGGMGNVFEAVQLPLERPCAVKVLARHLAADKHHREAFIREARIIGKLHHPHIVKVFSAGETDEYAYYAMESVHGQSLDRALPIGKHQLATFALHAALALAYAHQCGIIHCDIKPSNLLIDQGQRLLVSDFGLARINEREDSQATPPILVVRALTWRLNVANITPLLPPQTNMPSALPLQKSLQNAKSMMQISRPSSRGVAQLTLPNVILIWMRSSPNCVTS